jgi:hypothetical protein
MIHLYFGLMALMGIVELARVPNRAYLASEGAVGIDIATPLREGLILTGIGAVFVVLAALAHRGRNGARIGLSVAAVAYAVFGVLVVDDLKVFLISPVISIVYLAIALAVYWHGSANRWYRALRSAAGANATGAG